MSLNIVILGPPGAGKGTQAEGLARRHAVPRISTGDILREAVQTDTALGRAARAIMDAGHLVGDDIMNAIVSERLSKPDAARGFVLDGFPRTVGQAAALEEMMDGRGPLIIVNLVVPPDVIVHRLTIRRVCGSCGANARPDAPADARCTRCGGELVHRRDDDDGVIRERLAVFEEQTRPIIEYYRGRPTFFNLDGDRQPESVTGALEQALAAAVPMAGRRS